jgi:methylmalonyl-CoA mutase N-terminal domain/subunit
MKDRFGATEPKAQMLRFHTQTAGSTLTSQQSENNVVRVTMQALSAVLGGTQSLHTNGRDEALNLPTEESARLALRTQQIIAHESGAVDTIDPLGGSYFVEALTDDIASRAGELIARIDEKGGAVAAIEQGFIQREIHRSALAHQRAIENGDRIIVGVNKYQQDESERPVSFRVDESIRLRRIEGLNAVRERRDPEATRVLLDDLRVGATGQDNLFPLVLRCVEGDVTLGEICEVLEGVFGAYSEVRSF